VNARPAVLVAALAAIGAGWAGWWWSVVAAQPPTSARSSASTGEPAAPVRHPVHVHPGPQTPAVLALLPGRTTPERVACSTCHTTRAPNLEAHAGGDLDEFHQGLAYRHGGQSCLSCHNATNYDTLRRADGTALDYANTIQLCAQCHGPQHRDFVDGLHGGMTGYWDLTAGPRERKTCTNCHDPHAPAFPRVQPVFPPRDRGARQLQERGHAATPAGAESPAPAHE
jgi:hypothetical protein